MPQAYIRIVQANFNFADQTGQITLYAYRDQASQQAGRQPLTAFTFQVTPGGVPAVVDPVTGATLRPAEPSFSQLEAQLGANFDAIKAAFYALIAAQPQFAGGLEV